MDWGAGFPARALSGIIFVLLSRFTALFRGRPQPVTAKITILPNCVWKKRIQKRKPLFSRNDHSHAS
jgi:hypothetical protein